MRLILDKKAHRAFWVSICYCATPQLPLCSSPLPHYPSGEGSASPMLPPSVSTSMSGSPAPHGDKPPGAASPVPILELTRPQDHPTPQPIPEGKRQQEGENAKSE